MTEPFIDPFLIENYNQKIQGLLHIPLKSSPAIVVMCHGWTGNMHSHGLFIRCAEALCNHGFLVVRFDYRGSEHSEGDFTSITVESEVSDLRKIFKYLRNRDCDSSRIGVLGYSLGGLIALRGSTKQVKTLVLWAPTSRPVEEFQHILGPRRISNLKKKGYTWFRKDPSLYRQNVQFKVGNAFWQSIQRVDPLKEVTDLKCPTRIIHGINDDLVNYHHSVELKKQLSEPVDLQLIQEANHLFDQPQHADQLINYTVSWFSQWL